MPFGLCNGPSIFQWLMQEVLSPYLWLFALVYINDIAVYSKDWEDHLVHVNQVLSSIAKAGITL
jgi:lysozyme family protein